MHGYQKGHSDIWQEPDYTENAWKFDPIIEVNWKALLKRKELNQLPCFKYVSVASQSTSCQSFSNSIAQLVHFIHDRAFVIRIQKEKSVFIDLAPFIEGAKSVEVTIFTEEGAHLRLDCSLRMNNVVSLCSLHIHAGPHSNIDIIENSIFASSNISFQSIVFYAKKSSYIRYQKKDKGAIYNKSFIDAFLLEKNASLDISIIAQLGRLQYYSSVVKQQHCATQTRSNVLFKTVHRDFSSSFYYGDVTIHKDAVYSEASQSHYALLLSKNARAYALPSLQAKQNDIICTHGSAIGRLDEEQMWYLQSRGLEEKKAERLLVEAFLEKS